MTRRAEARRAFDLVRPVEPPAPIALPCDTATERHGRNRPPRTRLRAAHGPSFVSWTDPASPAHDYCARHARILTRMPFTANRPVFEPPLEVAC